MTDAEAVVDDVLKPAADVAHEAITSPEPVVEEAGAELERLVREVREELHTHNEHFNAMVGHLAATTEAVSRAVQAMAEGATETAAEAAEAVLAVPPAVAEAGEALTHPETPATSRRHRIGRRPS